MINIIRKNLIKEKLLPGFALKSHQKLGKKGWWSTFKFINCRETQSNVSSR